MARPLPVPVVLPDLTEQEARRATLNLAHDDERRTHLLADGKGGHKDIADGCPKCPLANRAREVRRLHNSGGA